MERGYERTKNGLKPVSKTGEYSGKSSPALWLEDTEFSHSGPQCAAVEAKDFRGPVFSADFPLSLIEDPHNMVALTWVGRKHLLIPTFDATVAL